jgi:ADP-ribosyl-[dinitrogen reductase] hydrolase
MTRQDSIIGCLLGTALGDSIGLPYEGLGRRRAERMLGPPDRHRLLFGRGMVSDDTEHTCMVAQALISSGGDPARFQQSLAWRLRLWLLALPAGVGFATLRALIKLWLGFGPERSGVFSAGNGPAMRAAVLGACMPDPQGLRDFVRRSTPITHTDPKAEYGAMAIALAAHMAAAAGRSSGPISPSDYVCRLQAELGADGAELVAMCTRVANSVGTGEDTLGFAASIGLGDGVSGYAYHSVPIALHAWLSHPQDLREAVVAAVSCGGDTDSVAAMVGGIVGAGVGPGGLPQDWLEGLAEWPCSVAWMQRLGAALSASGEQAEAEAAIPPRLPVLAVLARNLCFLVVILAHGLRRLAPPY